MTPLTGIGRNAENGAIAFATTHWSMVLTAQGESAAAQEALEPLCRIYWWPLYGFVRRQGRTPEEAQDLTQDFFALLLSRNDFDAVRREKGRLRSYLLASLKNFVAKAHRRAMAVKRGEGRPLVSLEELRARECADHEPADMLSADRIYERRWDLTVLEQVLARLGEEHQVAGRSALFEQLKQMLTHEPDRPSQAKIAQELGMTENAAKEAEIIATTIPPTDDLESAIVATLPADGYTTIVRGKDNTVELALVEVYQVNN